MLNIEVTTRYKPTQTEHHPNRLDKNFKSEEAAFQYALNQMKYSGTDSVTLQTNQKAKVRALIFDADDRPDYDLALNDFIYNPNLSDSENVAEIKDFAISKLKKLWGITPIDQWRQSAMTIFYLFCENNRQKQYKLVLIFPHEVRNES